MRNSREGVRGEVRPLSCLEVHAPDALDVYVGQLRVSMEEM